jgi:D-serine deaminase-like pyridoxal phosphate-dependent protein
LAKSAAALAADAALSADSAAALAAEAASLNCIVSSSDSSSEYLELQKKNKKTCMRNEVMILQI